MKKIVIVSIALVWISALAILILVLTNLYPNAIFQEHRIVVGIVFVIITAFLKRIYNAINKAW